MIQLTEKQLKFLIKNEDRMTIGDLAKKFNCTGKEVYAIYDKITSTREYKDYIRERVLQVTGKIKKRGKENEQMERFNENGKDKKKVTDRLPLIYINNDTYDTLSNSVL